MSTPYHTFERWRSDYREYVRLNEYGDHVIDDEGVRKIEAELAERQANHEHDERLCISRAKRIKELEAKLADHRKELSRITELVAKYVSDAKSRNDWLCREIGALKFQFPQTVKTVTESMELQVSLGARLVDDIQPCINFAASPDAREYDVAKLREEHTAMKAALVKATEACDANAQTAADAMRREACMRQDRTKLMEWLLETQAVAADLVGHPYRKADAEKEINEALVAAQKETSR